MTCGREHLLNALGQSFYSSGTGACFVQVSVFSGFDHFRWVGFDYCRVRPFRRNDLLETGICDQLGKTVDIEIIAASENTTSGRIP